MRTSPCGRARIQLALTRRSIYAEPPTQTNTNYHQLDNKIGIATLLQGGIAKIYPAIPLLRATPRESISKHCPCSWSPYRQLAAALVLESASFRPRNYGSRPIRGVIARSLTRTQLHWRHSLSNSTRETGVSIYSFRAPDHLTQRTPRPSRA